jgi:hypothetical protein
MTSRDPRRQQQQRRKQKSKDEDEEEEDEEEEEEEWWINPSQATPPRRRTSPPTRKDDDDDDEEEEEDDDDITPTQLPRPLVPPPLGLPTRRRTRAATNAPSPPASPYRPRDASDVRAVRPPTSLLAHDYPHFPLCASTADLAESLDAAQPSRLDSVLWPRRELTVRFEVAPGGIGAHIQRSYRAENGFTMRDLLAIVHEFYTSPLSLFDSISLRHAVSEAYSEEGRHLGTGLSFDRFFDAAFTRYVGEPIRGAHNAMLRRMLRPCQLLPGWWFEGFRVDRDGETLVPLIGMPF